MDNTNRRRLIGTGIAASALALGVGGAALANGGSLALVAYSVPQPAYSKLIPAFQKTVAGRGWSFTQSYGASGDQSRAVASGLPADVVNFATTPDVTRLVTKGLVSSTWNQNPHQGFVTDSVVVLIVRKGNPKHIHGWADLIKPGVSVVTPNPISSGGARWNILAAYGAQLKQGKSPDQAEAYLKSFFKHVPVQPVSAAQALTTFQNGEGDVLLDYESNAIFALKKGVKATYVVPAQDILIQTPVAVIRNSSNAGEAQRFVNFLWSPAGQTIFARNGFRPVLPSVAKKYTKVFPTPKKLFTVTYLGGWTSANTVFFAPNTGLVAQAQK
jgi:sulfate/thiosulfate-binding protein